jgi:hypothetical protein
MNLRSRAALPLVALTTTAALLVPTPGQAATTLGSTFPPTQPSSCLGGPDWELFQSSALNTVTKAGVVTSWRFEAGPQTTTLTMRVFHLVSPGIYTAVADGGPLQTVAASSGLHTFPTRVPVVPGDIIGLRSTTGACAAAGGPSDVYGFRSGTATPIGASAPYNSGNMYVVEMAADLEADADGDQYGDETQDGCPSSATSQASCTETSITRKPKQSSHGPKSKLSFVSSVAGATFTCSLDGRKGRLCTSPATYRCLRAGHHRFSVFATSPYGYADPTPATTKFRVSNRRHGC